MDTFISHSAAETQALGEIWGRAARAGQIIGLRGELGAGKTQWVKGLARGLEIVEMVRSPTFALVNEYRGGRLPLFHMDLFRLEKPGDIEAAGLKECLQPDGVAVIEWVERWPEITAPAATRGRTTLVDIEVLGEEERRITYEDPCA